MNLKWVYCLCCIFCSWHNLDAQIILDEVQDKKNIELINIGTTAVDVRNYWIYSSGTTLRVGTFQPICPYNRFVLEPGERFWVAEQEERSTIDGEVALFSSQDFDVADSLLSYVQWGSNGHDKEALAVQAGKWLEGEFVQTMLNDGSLEYDGDGISAADWFIQGVPSICDENGTRCRLPEFPPEFASTEPDTYCLGAGEQDLSRGWGNSGQNLRYVLLTPDSTIIAVSEEGGFSIDEVGLDTISLFLLSYDNAVSGLEAGKKIQDMLGCFSLSEEAVPVALIDLDAGEVSTSTGKIDTVLCSSLDNQNLNFQTDSEYSSYAYALTDTLDKTIAFSSIDDNSINLSEQPDGVYRVYGYAYIGPPLDVVGREIFDIYRSNGDCFSVSTNYVRLEKSSTTEACQVSVLSEHPQADQVSLFPNPGRHQIQVKVPLGMEIVSFTLYDTQGRQIAIGYSKDIQASNLPAGLYWLHLQFKDGIVSKKLLIE